MTSDFVTTAESSTTRKKGQRRAFASTTASSTTATVSPSSATHSASAVNAGAATSSLQQQHDSVSDDSELTPQQHLSKKAKHNRGCTDTSSILQQEQQHHHQQQIAHIAMSAPESDEFELLTTNPSSAEAKQNSNGHDKSNGSVNGNAPHSSSNSSCIPQHITTESGFVFSRAEFLRLIAQSLSDLDCPATLQALTRETAIHVEEPLMQGISDAVHSSNWCAVNQLLGLWDNETSTNNSNGNQSARQQQSNTVVISATDRSQLKLLISIERYMELVLAAIDCSNSPKQQQERDQQALVFLQTQLVHHSHSSQSSKSSTAALLSPQRVQQLSSLLLCADSNQLQRKANGWTAETSKQKLLARIQGLFPCFDGRRCCCDCCCDYSSDCCYCCLCCHRLYMKGANQCSAPVFVFSFSLSSLTRVAASSSPCHSRGSSATASIANDRCTDAANSASTTALVLARRHFA